MKRDDSLFLFDVKDFDEYCPLGFSAYDPYPRIREKIDEGREKFKEFKEFPCSIVLQNNGNAFVHLDSPEIVLGSNVIRKPDKSFAIGSMPVVPIPGSSKLCPCIDQARSPHPSELQRRVHGTSKHPAYETW